MPFARMLVSPTPADVCPESAVITLEAVDPSPVLPFAFFLSSGNGRCAEREFFALCYGRVQCIAEWWKASNTIVRSVKNTLYHVAGPLRHPVGAIS